MRQAASQYVRRNAVAFLALFVALGGTATATHLAVDGSDVVDESLTGADIEGSAVAGVEGAIKGEDLKDGTLNAKNLAVGAVNSLRVADDSLTSTDVKTRSLSWADLEFGTRNAFFVRTHGFSTTMLVAQDSGTNAIGETEVVASLVRRHNNGSSGEGFVRVVCTDDGFSVTYENIQAGVGAGHQRVWIDSGSSTRYRTLIAGALLTAVESNSGVPEAKRVAIRVHSPSLDMNGAFDISVARTPQGRGDPCLWHSTTVMSHEADLD